MSSSRLPPALRSRRAAAFQRGGHHPEALPVRSGAAPVPARRRPLRGASLQAPPRLHGRNRARRSRQPSTRSPEVSPPTTPVRGPSSPSSSASGCSPFSICSACGPSPSRSCATRRPASRRASTRSRRGASGRAADGRFSRASAQAPRSWESRCSRSRRPCSRCRTACDRRRRRSPIRSFSRRKVPSSRARSTRRSSSLFVALLRFVLPRRYASVGAAVLSRCISRIDMPLHPWGAALALDARARGGAPVGVRPVRARGAPRRDRLFGASARRARRLHASRGQSASRPPHRGAAPRDRRGRGRRALAAGARRGGAASTRPAT